MINMIKADFFRLMRSKGIVIAFVFIMAMIATDIYTVQPGSIGVHVNTGNSVENEISDMSYEEIQALSISEYRKIMLETKGYALDRAVLSANINLYYAFIFVAVIVITADFSASTVKNTLSSAISRNKYFFSKIAVVNICCLGLLFLNTYIMYFSNLIFNNRNLASSLGTVTKITLLQLPPILALVSVLTGFAFLLKKTAVFNTVAIPFIMVFQLLLSVLTMVFKIKEETLYYVPHMMFIKLSQNPSGHYIFYSYLVCAAMIVMFNLLGLLSFKKTEIK
ncbi:MAG: hypothetical protein J1E35_08685 [Lachnospiraceae bacterium]|nr:hypothetical protein [Lachnospiraceae bacterium]